MITICKQSYGFKYSYLKLIIFKQIYLILIHTDIEEETFDIIAFITEKWTTYKINLFWLTTNKTSIFYKYPNEKIQKVDCACEPIKLNCIVKIITVCPWIVVSILLMLVNLMILD